VAVREVPKYTLILPHAGFDREQDDRQDA